MSDTAFARFLRLGSPSDTDSLVPAEKKFNPYHDALGRFTFAPGGKLATPPPIPVAQSARSSAVPRRPESHRTSAGRAERISVIPGYPEGARTAWRSSNDAIFSQAARQYNAKYGLKAGDPDFKTPTFLKAWAMRESGGEGDQEVFSTDPFQVNVRGDWVREKGPIAGLRQGQVMTPALSAYGALEWLRYKSEVHDARGQVIARRSPRRALEQYNGREDRSRQSGEVAHKVWYAATIFQMADQAAKGR